MKALVKKYLPPRLYRAAQFVYGSKDIPHYWIPYALLNGRAFPPTHLTIETTFRCNLNCVMCPQATDARKEESRLRKRVRSVEEMSTEELKGLITDAAALGVTSLTVTGGEPLLKSDTLEVLAHAKRLRLTCTLLTNGTLLREEQARAIVEMGVDKVTFSLDGPPEVHESIRRVKGSFAKLEKAVGLLQAEKKRTASLTPSLSLTCTISSANADCLSETVDVAAGLRVGLHFGYLFYTSEEMEERTERILSMGDAKDEDQQVAEHLKRIDVAQLSGEIARVREKAKQHRLRVSFQPPIHRPDDIARRFTDDSHAYCSKCFYPWYAVRVNPYGEVYPCSMGIKMGDIRSARLGEIWNGERYVRFRRTLKREGLFPKCVKCCVLRSKTWTYLPRF